MASRASVLNLMVRENSWEERNGPTPRAGGSVVALLSNRVPPVCVPRIGTFPGRIKVIAYLIRRDCKKGEQVCRLRYGVGLHLGSPGRGAFPRPLLPRLPRGPAKGRSLPAPARRADRLHGLRRRVGIRGLSRRADEGGHVALPIVHVLEIDPEVLALELDDHGLQLVLSLP